MMCQALLCLNEVVDIIMPQWSSSSSSHDRPIGPLPAKCWPEAFHATFIHHIRERGKTERMEEKLRYHYQYHHNYLPPPLAPQLLQMEVGEESREEEPQKTQSHSHSCSFRSRLVILGGITNRMQGLKFNQSAFYGKLQYTSNYLQYKSNYTRR